MKEKATPFKFGDQVILKDKTGFDVDTKFYIKTHPLDYKLRSSLGLITIEIVARRNGLECLIERDFDGIKYIL